MNENNEEIEKQLFEVLPSVGLVATVVACVAMVIASISFAIAQATTIPQQILNGSFGASLTAAGMVSFSAIIIKYRAEGFRFIMILMLVFGAFAFVYDAVALVGWKSVMDSDYMKNSDSHKKTEMAVNLASERVKRMSTSTVDTVAKIREKTKFEADIAHNEALAKTACKHGGRTCKSKYLAPNKELKAKAEGLQAEINEAKSAISAIDTAQVTIENSNTGNAYNETMLHYQTLAKLVFGTEKESVAMQGIMRIFTSAMIVTLCHFGFVFYTVRNKRFSRLLSGDSSSGLPDKTVSTYYPEPENTVLAKNTASVSSAIPENTPAKSISFRGHSQLLGKGKKLFSGLFKKQDAVQKPKNTIGFVIDDTPKSVKTVVPVSDVKIDIDSAVNAIRPPLVSLKKPINWNVSKPLSLAKNTGACITGDIVDTVDIPKDTAGETSKKESEGHLTIMSHMKLHKDNFFESYKNFSINMVIDYLRANGIPCSQGNVTKAVNILKEEGYPKTRDVYLAEKESAKEGE